MTNKEKFNLDNYHFKIIEMDVYNSTKTIIMKYSLLVDELNFIHDYKVNYKKIEVTNTTTASHKTTKKNNISLKYRVYLLDQLGLKHKFQESGKHNKRKEKYFFDSDYINNQTNLNSNYCIMEYRKITFQNINYILSGSNPTGEGKGKGTYFTRYNDKDINFGFFLQCLNVSKNISNTFYDIKYDEVWQSDHIQIMSFKEWLDSELTIRELFLKFDKDKEKWKIIKKQFEVKYEAEKNKFINIERKINKLRHEQKTRINKFENIKFIVSDFFSANTTKFEFAHIKPVWYIKKEYNNFIELNKDDNINANKILEQISDYNNFLPLPGTVHSLYDSYYFYWNESGELVKLKDDLKMDDINSYLKINNEKLTNIKFFLQEYHHLLINEKKIS